MFIYYSEMLQCSRILLGRNGLRSMFQTDKHVFKHMFKYFAIPEDC